MKRISRLETDAGDQTTNLSTGLVDDCAPSFSVPFGGCVGARETDGVDLSEGVVVGSATFFSPPSCAGTGVEGRGECVTPFYHDLESAYPSRCSTSSYLGNHVCGSP